MIKSQTAKAGPLNGAEAVHERLGFQEIHEKPPNEVSGHKHAEQKTVLTDLSAHVVQSYCKCGKEENLVRLCGMAGKTIAEIHPHG